MRRGGAQKQNIIYVLNLDIELYNTTLFNGFKKIKIKNKN